MKTKRDLVSDWIRTRVHRAINERIASEAAKGNHATAHCLAVHAQWIAIDTASACFGKYDFLELEDIMHWRKRKVAQ